MKKPSRTVPRRRQSVSPTPRHLPLVDILIDTQAELQELVVASGLKVLEAMLEEDRAAVCGPRYAHQPARQAYRTGHTPSPGCAGRAEGGDSSAPCAARRRGGSVANGPGIRECGRCPPGTRRAVRTRGVVRDGCVVVNQAAAEFQQRTGHPAGSRSGRKASSIDRLVC